MAGLFGMRYSLCPLRLCGANPAARAARHFFRAQSRQKGRTAIVWNPREPREFSQRSLGAEKAQGRGHRRDSEDAEKTNAFLCAPAIGVLSIRIVHLCDDSQTAESLTADFPDTADKGRRISDYPRHLRHLRLNVLAGSLACPPEVGCGLRPRCELSGLK